METMYKAIILLVFFNFCLFCSGQELDLKRNMGWASVTRGGDGGKIIRVTNLNKSGKGSLFAALRSTGKRTIVFDVGGEINLDGTLITIRDPYITVLGQTAPSPGITIVNGAVTITTHDVLIQHIRIRPGSADSKKSLDALSTSKGAYNIIIDHCSLTWAVDENLTASGPRFDGKVPSEWRKNTSHRITFSNNIIGEGLSHSIHEKGEHSMGTLVHDNVTDILIMRNLYISNNDRNAFFKGGSRGIFLNNYIYNPGIRAIWYSLSASEWSGHNYEAGYLSIVGNVLRLGQDSDPNMSMILAKGGPLKLYMEDNIMYNAGGGRVDNIYSGDKKNIVATKPIWVEDLQVLKSKDLEKEIIRNVGARPWDRDMQDARIIQSILNKDSKIINSEKQFLVR